MCGILFLHEKRPTTNSNQFADWLELMNSRGPDQKGQCSFTTDNGQFFVGDARLRISDPHSRSDQPFTIDHHYFLIFNGEIYNHKSLRKELLHSGVTFKTESDTETLIWWLKIHGVSRLSELNGMFAFVYVDKKKKETIIARDQHGIKPLYFLNSHGTFITASDLRSIVAHPKVSNEINKNQISHYLKYQFIKRPETIYKSIKELEPGHFLKWTNGVYEEPQPYIHFNSNKSFSADLFEPFQNHFNKSLILHSSDIHVPGIMLSGGIDSTLLLASAKRKGLDISAYSITMEEKAWKTATDDTSFARQAAKQYQVPLHEYRIDEHVVDQLPEFFKSFDQPIGDSSAFLTWLISKYAKQNGSKILWSGAGADEYWAGYRRHALFKKYLQIKKYLPVGSEKITGILSQLTFPNINPGDSRRFWSSFSPNAKSTYLQFVSSDPDLPYQENSAGAEFDLNDALNWDRNQYLISDVLALTDKASMAHGIEVRVPYLDNHLTSLAQSTEASVLLKHGAKWPLKHLLVKMDGGVYCSRKKQGFGLPFELILNDIYTFLWDFFYQPDHPIFEFVENKQMERLKYLHLGKHIGSGRSLWALLSLVKWLEHQNNL